MELSIRLKTVADEVKSRTTVADVGTDHAYIPIYLLKTGRVQRAIAMDVKKGPLSKAEDNIAAYGFKNKIETRLSDGLSALSAEEADSIIIAGMGGALVSRILQEGSHVLSKKKELILQPQSELYKVRRQLHQIGYRIVEEKMVLDEGKFYTIMRALAGKEAYEEEYEYLYGRRLLEKRDPILYAFLERESESCDQIEMRLKQFDTEATKSRLVEINQLRQNIRRARNIYEM